MIGDDPPEHLNRALRPLVEAAESWLELDEAKRMCTILWVNSDGGSVEDISWVLERGHWVLVKDNSAAGRHNWPTVLRIGSVIRLTLLASLAG